MSTKDSKKLNLGFSSEVSNVTISLPDPKDDLDSETVATAMNEIIGLDTLLDSNGNPIIAVESAEIVTTSVQTLF